MDVSLVEKFHYKKFMEFPVFTWGFSIFSLKKYHPYGRTSKSLMAKKEHATDVLSVRQNTMENYNLC